MSNTYPPNTAPPGSDGVPTGGSPREQASHLSDEAASAGHRVADVSKDEASRVASEAKKQAADVLAEARTQLSDQASEQQTRVAQGLRSISDELTGMVRSTETEGGGVASDLVQKAAQRAGTAASWLDARDPGSLLQEVREFARRKPGTFIALAATAGVLAGRLTRSVVSNEHDSSHGTSSDSTGRHAPLADDNLGTGNFGTGSLGTGSLGANNIGTASLGSDALSADPDFQRGDGFSADTGYRGVDGLGSPR